MTIEMVNTDADGRLVLADCLASARREAAERLVNVATLTCGAVTALGFTYAALFVNNEDWAAQLPAAAEQSGERVLRLPLHEETPRGCVSGSPTSSAPRRSGRRDTLACQRSGGSVAAACRVE
jgi:leucyl aminopeptidase